MKDLDTFLESAEKKEPQCAYCKNDKLREELEKFMVKKAKRETTVSLTDLHENYLVPTFHTLKHTRKLINHVRNCMNRDHRTGRLLDE